MQLLFAGRLALLPLFAGIFSSGVVAADLGAPPAYPMLPLAYDWSGLHIGITGGGAFNGHDPSFSYENIDAASVAILPHGADLTSKGGLVGGEIGYDLQGFPTRRSGGAMTMR